MADCDSSFWTGPFIVDDGGDCDDISILPENQGVFEYVYTATNDFGCTATDTMVVTVEPAPEGACGGGQLVRVRVDGQHAGRPGQPDGNGAGKPRTGHWLPAATTAERRPHYGWILPST